MDFAENDLFYIQAKAKCKVYHWIKKCSCCTIHPVACYWQCLFFRQNVDGNANGLARAIVPPSRSLAEMK